MKIYYKNFKNHVLKPFLWKFMIIRLEMCFQIFIYFTHLEFKTYYLLNNKF